MYFITDVKFHWDIVSRIYLYDSRSGIKIFFFLLEDFNHFNTIHNQREYLIFWFQN